jgi:hypothetical protein
LLLLFCLSNWWLMLLLLDIPPMLRIRYLGHARTKRLTIRSGAKTQNALLLVCFHKALQDDNSL